MRIARREKMAALEGGSVLILVLWVAFGLVSIALYFAHSMTFELRAADNRVAAIEAGQAIDGAARYASYLLSNLEENEGLPEITSYQREMAPVGDSYFWFIGRGDRQVSSLDPFFSLGDESGKLNLNTATRAMLEKLPRMTPELAAAIVDWRDADGDVTSGGAEEETYLRLRPPYRCKNARFESVEELRLVFGMDLEILYGEDWNQNGVLDPNENNGDASPPADNRDGRLDPGLIEYLTVWSREPNTREDGSRRINVSTPQGRQQLGSILREKFGQQRAQQILARFGGPGPGPNIRSALEFFLVSGMTADEFGQIQGDITTSNNPAVEGLVNVNSAGAAVLACLPGIERDQAEALVAFRQANPGKLTSVAWVAEVLERGNAIQAGPFITARSFQVCADIAAVGRHGRGYRRVRYVIDRSSGTPRIVARRDLTDLGWALGRAARQKLDLARNFR